MKLRRRVAASTECRSVRHGVVERVSAVVEELRDASRRRDQHVVNKGGTNLRRSGIELGVYSTCDGRRVLWQNKQKIGCDQSLGHGSRRTTLFGVCSEFS